MSATIRCSAVVLAIAVTSWSVDSLPSLLNPQRAPVDGYRVVNVYPHDPDAYTQGLIFRDGYLFESTGQYGRSTLRKVELRTGHVVQQRRLAPEYFGEGLAEWSGRLMQLTWDSQLAFVYDLSSFAPQGTFGYSGEGWGLTHNGREFILSDGSATLRYLDPATFRETKRVVVTDAGVPVKNLNELEHVRGEIYANVWHTDRIARISPQSGKVTRWIDLTGLMPAVHQLDPEAVLNGIAYDVEGKRLFVTGKLWPKLFEIEVVPRSPIH